MQLVCLTVLTFSSVRLAVVVVVLVMVVAAAIAVVLMMVVMVRVVAGVVRGGGDGGDGVVVAGGAVTMAWLRGVMWMAQVGEWLFLVTCLSLSLRLAWSSRALYLGLVLCSCSCYQGHAVPGHAFHLIILSIFLFCCTHTFVLSCPQVSYYCDCSRAFLSSSTPSP